MLDSYFYQGEVPEPEAVLDMARQCLVASTASNHHECWTRTSVARSWGP